MDSYRSIPFSAGGEYPGVVIRCSMHLPTVQWMDDKIAFAAVELIHWAACQHCGVAGPMAPGEQARCLAHCKQTYELGGGDSRDYSSFFPPHLQGACWAAYKIGGIPGVRAVVDTLGWSEVHQEWRVYE